MATAIKSQSKTNFVELFLRDNPRGNAKAVNEAWSASGMIGTIGATLVNKMRSEMGLTGNLRAKATPGPARAKSGREQSKTAGTPGKSMFVKEYLNDHPQGNVDAVNEAWVDAGFDGTISSTLINKMRASLGLTGNLRGNRRKPKASATGVKRGRPRLETTAASGVQTQVSPSASPLVLNDLEADIDRLIFKAMAIGDLNEIESSLRRARRILYGALTQG